MKLSDLIQIRPKGKLKVDLSESTGVSQSAIDILELDRLTSASLNFSMQSSPNIDELEIELAQLIIEKLSRQTHLVPSQTVMQFIRSLNAKV